jgi:hypothetical protein
MLADHLQPRRNRGRKPAKNEGDVFILLKRGRQPLRKPPHCWYFHLLTLHAASVLVVGYFVANYPDFHVDAWFIRRRKMGRFQILDAALERLTKPFPGKKEMPGVSKSSPSSKCWHSDSIHKSPNGGHQNTAQ